MKKKIIEAITNLQESPDSKAKIGFTNTFKEKSFKATISYSDFGVPDISLVSHKGYSKDYLNKKLKEHLSDIRNATTFHVQSGDIILTRQNPPSPGTIITLAAGTYYYSVNAGFMSCNGDQLHSPFQARYIKTLTAKCDLDSEIMRYSQFKII